MFDMLTLNPNNPHPHDVAEIVSVLKSGGVVCYPTDTIYGLGCDIFNKKAIEKLYRIKKREKKKQFSFICSDFTQIGEFAVLSNEVFRLMRRVLPGAYTFILPASTHAPRTVVEKKRRTVGIRMPNSRLCMDIVSLLGNPLVTTSVNYSGQDSLNDPVEIEREFGSRLDLVVDGGILQTEPSTILDATTDTITVIRQGKGPLEPLNIW